MTLSTTRLSSLDSSARHLNADRADAPVPGGPGEYLAAYHFFSRTTRGTFACYRRAKAGTGAPAFKVCVRAELLPLPDARAELGPDPITFELNLTALRHAVAVARGERREYSHVIPRPGHPPKTFALYRNPDGTLVLRLSAAGRTLTGVGEAEAAYRLQDMAIELFSSLYANTPELVAIRWQAFLAVPVLPPRPEPS